MLQLAFMLVAGLISSTATANMFYSHLPVNGETYVRRLKGRLRRDVNESSDEGLFPKYRSFTLTLEGTKVRLDLKLNERQTNPVTIKLYDNGQFVEFDNSAPRDYAFYQQIQPESQAAVMVRCKDRQITACHIIGHIRVGDKDYIIEPTTQEATLVSKAKHVLYNIDPKQQDQDYTLDTRTFVIDESDEDRQILVNEGRGTSSLEGNSTLTNESRVRRETNHVNHRIELGIVVDFDIYNFWLKRVGYDSNAAVGKITQYYELLVNDMDLRYASAKTQDMSIDIVLRTIVIIQSSSGTPWLTENSLSGGLVDAGAALENLVEWVDENSIGLTDFDAIMSFTSKDLAIYKSSQQSYSRTVVGVAYQFSRQSRPLSATCRRLRAYYGGPRYNYAVSLIEDLNMGDVAGTAAHELAHNLGVGHDNAEGCKKEHQFIMASVRRHSMKEVTPGNPWAFSPCSVDAMSTSLQDLLTEGYTCLQDEDTESTESEYNQKIGAFFTLDQQCQLYLAEDSYFCRSITPDLSTVCHEGIYCFMPWTTNSCQHIFVMDGTDCSNGGEDKICDTGYCVNRPLETAESTTSVSTSSASAPTTSSASTTSTPAPSTSTITSAPSTSSLAPITSTPAPSTGTPALTTSSPNPGTGTAAPSTSSLAASTSTPATSSPAPATSTPAPTTSSPAPGTSTPAPTTSSPAPGTSTPAPTTSSLAPATSTPAPTSSSPVVSSGTTEPTTISTTLQLATSTHAPTTTSSATMSTTASTLPTTTQRTCDIYCYICLYLYQHYNKYIWDLCPEWVLPLLH